jgi:hypothetical protein
MIRNHRSVHVLKAKGCDITHILYYLSPWRHIMVVYCFKRLPTNETALDTLLLRRCASLANIHTQAFVKYRVLMFM